LIADRNLLNELWCRGRDSNLTNHIQLKRSLDMLGLTEEYRSGERWYQEPLRPAKSYCAFVRQVAFAE